MAIRGPKGAEPTTRGWINPRTGELLKSQRITAEQIAEWHGHTPEPVVQTLHEAPVVERHVSQEEYDYHHANLSDEVQDDHPAEDEQIKLW